MDRSAEANNDIAKLLEAQAHIWNHIFNFINSMSLKCAVELGIPDIIHSHGKPITISELNNALSVHPNKAHCISRLMLILVHFGFFALAKINSNDDEEGYILTNTSQLLLKDNPLSLAPLLLFHLDPDISKPGHFLSSWFVNDDPTPFSATHGMEFWDYVVKYPKINMVFNKAMANDTRLVSSALTSNGKAVFDGISSMVDVGGGTGTLAKAITEAFPSIQSIVLDFPHVLASLNDTPHVKYVAGDMFESIPSADAVMLKWILHNWNDEDCLRILRRCKKAVKEKVIIIDMVKDYKEMDKEAIETQLLYDMSMMVFFAGKQRNEEEWAKLFCGAGFSGYKIIPILGLRSIIEAYP